MLYIITISLIFISSYILIFRQFKLSLYVLLVLSVLTHKELFSFYRWDLMPVRIFMLALLCVGVTKIYLHVVKNRSIKSLLPFLKDPFILTILIIWFVRGLSIIFSKNLQASLLLYGFFTTIVSLGLFIYLTFKDKPGEVIKYLKFYSYVVFAITLFGFIQLYYFYKTGNVIGAMWPVPGKIPRIGTLFWDVNHFGALLAALLPALCSFVITEKSLKKKALNILMILIYSLFLFLTNSRTAWMIAGFSFLFFATMLMMKRFGSKGILYIFIAIILLISPFVHEYTKKKSEFRRQVRDAFHYRIDSFDSHLMLLTGAYQIFEKYPYLGGGYGSFFEHFSKTKIAPEFFTRDTAALSNRVPAHTIWGESLSETGVIGTVPFVFFFLMALISPLYSFFKDEKLEKRLMGGVISAVMFGWYIAGIFYSYNSEFFWILVFMYFTWSVGVLGLNWFKKIINFFFNNGKILFFIVALISFCLIFAGLGTNHLIPWDEAIYAKVAKNMVVRNEYIIPYWDNFITGWFEKPPLFMWMMSGLMGVIGFNSWSARIPSAVFGFLTVLLVFHIGKKFFNKTVAFISSLAIVTTVHFLYYSRASMLDVTATFFITLSLFFYWQAKESKRWVFWVLYGLSTGLAVMTKGVVGLLPFLITSLYDFFSLIYLKDKITRKLVLGYLISVVSMMVVAFPWHFAMYKMFGHSFTNKYFLYHVWDRAVSGIEDKGNPFFWYVIVMKVSMRIWFIALLGALPLALFKSVKKDRKFIFLSVWALSVFMFFSVAKSKLVWYIIPIYPAVSLMVGYFLERVLDFIMSRFKYLNNQVFKFFAMYLLVIFSLFYLFLNRELVYTSDLNGSQARLLMLKDEVFGTEKAVHLDRMELPTAYFYTDGPFVATDVNVTDPSRVPIVSVDDPLIIISRKGRFREDVIGHTKKAKIIKEDDSWMLWYVPSESGAYILESQKF